jgi:hypothetical protein
MKQTGKTFLAPAFIILLLQLSSVLLGFNQAVMLLTGLILSLLYLTYQGFFERIEAIIATSTFVVSTVVASIIGRITSYDRLCQGTDPVRPLCEGYVEWYLNFFVTDLSFNWPYWLLFTALAIASVLIYRRYRG